MRQKQVFSTLVSVRFSSSQVGDTVKVNYKISGCRPKDFSFLEYV